MWRDVWTTAGVFAAGVFALAACTPSVEGDDLALGSRLPDRTSQNASDAGQADASSKNSDAAPPPTNPGSDPTSTTNDAGSAVDSGPIVNPPPAPTPPCGQMSAGMTLMRDQSIDSCDKRFTLIMQSDSNLVLYKNGVGALWSSNTYGTGAERAVMQGDGNFVVYNAVNQPFFNTGTFNHPGAIIAVQNDGNLVVYEGGQALWASNTSGN